MVLDMARPKNKQNTIWRGMRGRDASRKLILKADIVQVLTIDFSEIQFTVNQNTIDFRAAVSIKNRLHRESGEQVEDFSITIQEMSSLF